MLQVFRQEHLLASSSHGPLTLSLGQLFGELVGSILEPGLESAAGGTELSPQEMDLQVQLVGALKDLYLAGAAVSSPLPAEVSSHVLHSLRSVKAMAVSAEERLFVLTPLLEVNSSWKLCAVEGATCSCDGLVRYGGNRSWSAARFVTNSTPCMDVLFEALAEHSAADSQSQRQCHCKSWSQPQRTELLRSHLSLLERELSDVFCEAGETFCQKPRVPLVHVSILAEPAPVRSSVRIRVAALGAPVAAALVFMSLIASW